MTLLGHRIIWIYFLVFCCDFIPVAYQTPEMKTRSYILHVKYEIRNLYASSRPIRLLIFFELTINFYNRKYILRVFQSSIKYIIRFIVSSITCNFLQYQHTFLFNNSLRCLKVNIFYLKIYHKNFFVKFLCII